MAIFEGNVVSQSGFTARTLSTGTTVLGRTVKGGGAVGDRLQRLILHITQPGDAGVTLLDGWNEIPVLIPSSSIRTGPMFVELGLYSINGAWSVRIGGGVSGVAIGVFTAVNG